MCLKQSEEVEISLRFDDMETSASAAEVLSCSLATFPQNLLNVLSFEINI